MLAVENNAGLDAKLDSRFGRAAYFVIYDTDTEQIISNQENKFKDQAQGVGIKTASYVAENNCQMAIGARPGPKAASVLVEAKIKMVVAENCTAREAIEKYC